MINSRKMRCNRISVYETNGVPAGQNQPVAQVATERGFTSNGEDGKPLNGPEVQSVSYNDVTIADQQDLSVKLNDVVNITVSPVSVASIGSKIE